MWPVGHLVNNMQTDETKKFCSQKRSGEFGSWICKKLKVCFCYTLVFRAAVTDSYLFSLMFHFNNCHIHANSCLSYSKMTNDNIYLIIQDERT